MAAATKVSISDALLGDQVYQGLVATRATNYNLLQNVSGFGAYFVAPGTVITNFGNAFLSFYFLSAGVPVLKTVGLIALYNALMATVFLPAFLVCVLAYMHFCKSAAACRAYEGKFTGVGEVTLPSEDSHIDHESAVVYQSKYLKR